MKVNNKSSRTQPAARQALSYCLSVLLEGLWEAKKVQSWRRRGTLPAEPGRYEI